MTVDISLIVAGCVLFQAHSIDLDKKFFLKKRNYHNKFLLFIDFQLLKKKKATIDPESMTGLVLFLHFFLKF